MIHLIYISSVTQWPREGDLVALLEQSRRRNASLDVTGLLVYDNATFLQVLEGPREGVRQIFESIQRDPRNTGIVKLREEEIARRAFPEWRMGFKDLGSEAPRDLPGFSGIFRDGRLDRELLLANHCVAADLISSFVRKRTEVA